MGLGIYYNVLFLFGEDISKLFSFVNGGKLISSNFVFSGVYASSKLKSYSLLASSTENRNALYFLTTNPPIITMNFIRPPNYTIIAVNF